MGSQSQKVLNDVLQPVPEPPALVLDKENKKTTPAEELSDSSDDSDDDNSDDDKDKEDGSSDSDSSSSDSNDNKPKPRKKMKQRPHQNRLILEGFLMTLSVQVRPHLRQRN